MTNDQALAALARVIAAQAEVMEELRAALDEARAQAKKPCIQCDTLKQRLGVVTAERDKLRERARDGQTC